MKKKLIALILVLAMALGLAPMTAAAGDNPFTDVGTRHYFYDAVMWAYETGVTTGTSATEFGPYDYCTRGQVVTFLWRAAGKPEPSGSRNPFTDVKSSDYFYKAVLWAVEQGITTGTTTTTFSPDDTCTNAQVITFLWRAVGKPSAAASGTKAAEFEDSDYFKTAVAWGDRKGMFDRNSKFYANVRTYRSDIVYYIYTAMGADSSTVLIVPDMMAYFGATDIETSVSDGYTSYETKFDPVDDYNFTMMEDFAALVEKHGFQLKLVNDRKSHDDHGDYRYFWYEYTGPDADKVGVTSKGSNYNFSIIYQNTHGYDDPEFNCCVVRACIGKGLTAVDTGERVSRKLYAFVPQEQPTPTPTPTPKPTPEPTTPLTPTTAAGPYQVDQQCIDCDGTGKLGTCGYCFGYGQVSMNGGPAETCPYCSGSGKRSCPDCGGDGELNSGDPDYVGAKWVIPAGYVGRCVFCDGDGKFKCVCDNGTQHRWNGVTKQMDYFPCTVIGCNNGWISCDGCGGDGRIDLTDPHDA